MLAESFAICLLLGAEIALGLAPTRQHHVPILFLTHAGHRGRRELEAEPVCGEDLGEKIDVSSQRDHAVVVPGQYCGLLVSGHGPLVQIAGLIGLESFAIMRFH